MQRVACFVPLRSRVITEKLSKTSYFALFKFLVEKWEFVEVRVTNSDIRICEFRALRRKDSKAQHKLPPAP